MSPRKIGWFLLTIGLLMVMVGWRVMNQKQQATHLSSPLLVAPVQPPSPPASTRSLSSDAGDESFLPVVSLARSWLEQQIFNLINRDRAAQGLYPYTWSSILASGAWQHSVRMSNPNCGMSHQCFGEPDPCTRVANEGISWASCGENIGYSGPNPTDWAALQLIEQSMLNEQPPDDGHRVNLLNTSYHRLGVGIYIDSTGIIWVTEDFAN